MNHQTGRNYFDITLTPFDLGDSKGHEVRAIRRNASPTAFTVVFALPVGLSRKSPFFGKVDIIFSKIPLGAGHKYYVLLNDEMKNPTIRKMFQELSK